MKYVRSITFRALSAFFIGGLLLAFPLEISNWLVIVIGILFLIPGLVSIGAYFSMRAGQETMRPIFPIVGVGSLFFGLILTLFSATFVPYLRYALALFLVLACIAELVSVFKMSRHTSVGAFFYVVPFLLACAGLFVIFFNKLAPQEYNMILGVASVVYAIQELLDAIRFRKVRRELSKIQKEEEAAAEIGQDAGQNGELLPSADDIAEPVEAEVIQETETAVAAEENETPAAEEPTPVIAEESETPAVAEDAEDAGDEESTTIKF